MADGDVPYRLRVPLSEGDQLLQLIFQDKYGNFYTTAKRYVVDLTPPRLEMIQPLPKHQTALDGYASGFVEAGARLVVNGMEVEPDGEGYFRVENIGASLEIEVSDAAGNSTHYAWEQERGSSPVIWIVLLNAGLIAIAGCAIWWIRKKWGTSTEA